MSDRFGPTLRAALGLALALSGLLPTANAAIHHVPATYPTIQAGIDAAVIGDTVLVAAGTYAGPGNQNLTIGKDLVLLSEMGAAQTTIDAAPLRGGQGARGFNLMQVGAGTEIVGFTVRGGDARGLSQGAGGGAFLILSSPTFRECIFRENQALAGISAGGGAVACLASSPRFMNCAFVDNLVTGPSSVGGAVALYAQLSMPVFEKCHFEGNESGTAGGALFVWDNAAPTLDDCTFVSNRCDIEGGALFTGLTQPTIRHCVFSANIAHTGGGALIAGTADISDCEVTGNQAAFGGGLHIGPGQILVRRCRISDNTASAEGGGVRCSNSSTGSGMELRECVLTGNTAPLGGSVFIYRATLAMVGCTLAGNSSGIHVGRIGDPVPSSLTAANTIVSGSSSGPALQCSPASSALLHCSDLFGNVGGDWTGCIAGQNGKSGNFTVDPCYCGPAAADFTLHADSPCAPGHSPAGCDLIGALPVGCADGCLATAVEQTTWGRIKAMHR
jgi:hypothetical protein